MSIAVMPSVTVTAPRAGRVTRFYADTVEVKAQGPVGDVFELTAHAGCEPPMHVHDREDESFYVLEGRVAFHTPEGVVHGEPGTYVELPRGVAHTYVVESGTARMLVTATPSGFLEMFDAVQDAFGGTMPESPAPEHGPVLGATLGRFGISVVGPNPAAR